MTDKEITNNKLILQIVERDNRGVINHHKIDSFPATIGRGFDNDIILNDPYISENHIEIKNIDDEKWLLTDLDSLNGYSINKAPKQDKESYFKSGDFIRIGNTIITFFHSGHKIEKAKRLVTANKFVKTISKAHIGWALFFLVGILSATWSYLEIWSANAKENAVSYGVIIVSTILLWSVIWGISARLLHNKKSFFGQMSIACIWVIFIGFLSYVSKYIEYFTGGGVFIDIITNGADLIALVVLIFGSLTLFSDMPSKRRWITSIIFSFGLLVGIVGFDLLSKKETILRPEYSKTIEPYFTEILPSSSLDEFVSGLEDNFKELQKEK